MTFCKLLTALVVIHNAGGLLGSEVKSSIVGGQDAPENRWPWMVHLVITSDGINKWRCGGTILNSRWVLTAANCWDRLPGRKDLRSMVWIGSHNLQKGAARYMAIVHIIPHTKYQAVGRGFVNDIALVNLKKEISFSQRVSPVSLPRPDDTFDSSSECWITGWGNVETGVPLPDPEVLQELRISIISQSSCKAIYPELTDGMLCAGDLAGGKDTCKVSLYCLGHGGPLVCRTAKGFVQVGIMSYGSHSGCGFQGQPGVYTKVSEYLDFINGYIHQSEETSAEV